MQSIAERVMEVIEREGSVAGISKLAELTGLKYGTVWQTVRYLEKAGKVRLRKVAQEGGGTMYEVSLAKRKYWTKDALKKKILSILQVQRELPALALLKARIDPAPGMHTFYEALNELEQEGKIVLRKHGNRNVAVALRNAKCPLEAMLKGKEEKPKAEVKVDIKDIVTKLARKFLVTFEGNDLVAVAGSKLKISDLAFLFESKLDAELSISKKGLLMLRIKVGEQDVPREG